MSFAVVTDTSGNLPSERIRKAGLYLIPFSYYIDEKEYSCTDSEAFDGDEFYARIKGGLAVTTSQITPQHYADFFEPFLTGGQDVLYVSMSSGISGSCDCARVAAGMLAEDHPDRVIEVVDTKGASLGEGLVALEAARLRDRGLGVSEAAEKLRDYSSRMCNVFTVDDLMHLKRGGRLSAVKALVGSVLNLKPILITEGGKFDTFAKVRGIKACKDRIIDALKKELETRFQGVPHSELRLATASTLESAEDAEAWRKMVQEAFPEFEVTYDPLSCSIACHTGIGAVGAGLSRVQRAD